MWIGLCDDFQWRAPTRNVNLLVSYLSPFVSKLSALLPLCPAANIILTLFRLGSMQDLGENVEKEGSFGSECLHKKPKVYALLIWLLFLYIGHDSFSSEQMLQKTSIMLQQQIEQRTLNRHSHNKRKQLRIEQDKCNMLRPRTTGSFPACMNEVLSSG